MKKQNDSDSIDPKLRVLDGGDNDTSSEDIQVLQVDEESHVEVLTPGKVAPHDAKSFIPDVAGILDNEEEVVDAEENWGANKLKLPPLGWFVLAGLVVTGLTFWATVSVYKAQPGLDTVEREKEDLERKRAEEAIKVKKTLTAMESAVKGYLEATTIDEMLKHVRHPERVKLLMQSYYSKHPITPRKYARLERTRSLGLETLSFLYGQAVLEDGSKKNLVLQQLGDESFAVDWESDVCYQPIDWQTYLQTRPSEAKVMRVRLEVDNFYAYEFRDEDLYDCYRITTRGHDGHLFGFVSKESKVARGLKDFVETNNLSRKNAKAQPLMLELRFPEGSASKNCVWIDSLVAPRWLMIDSPGGR